MSRNKLKAFVGGVALLTAVSLSGTVMAAYDGFGSDIPLNLAAREIIPEGWTVDYGDGVDRDANVSWSSASDWKQALQNAVSKRGYAASFGTNSVVISKASGSSTKPYSSDAKTSSATSKPRAPRSAPAKRNPAPAPATAAAEAPLQGGGGFTIRPYKGGKPVEDVKGPAERPDEGRLATKGEKFEPYKPAASQFTVSAGQMLHPVLAEWASKSGWTVIWESEYDYRIEANASFNGNFVDAVTQIVTAMAEARPAITVDFYQGNNVAVVSNKAADAVN
ncbi:toxin co-regulated pilus biosynthesis Q family protein [Mesorhizobium sp. SP-1A]|uniref:toxin co-regulated pilus biosynthesis Q family protein n=1 Tax=Mesorhizobium sp. SP-1A TaxID=3077840 RepID=UPI0028F7394B|nr:toxin co-regulated pilus biosynthesis Q family protein [Mesorhizobium sp. SP-1A]